MNAPFEIKLNWCIETNSWVDWTISKALFFDAVHRGEKVPTEEELRDWGQKREWSTSISVSGS